MRKSFRHKMTVLLFSALMFTNCFSQENGKAMGEVIQKDDRTGFLSNIKELKEISDVMDVVSENFVGDKNIDKKVLLQGALRGMVEALDDQHSSYFTKDQLANFKEDIKGKYVGVGMVVQKKKNEPLLVVSPIEDGPGFKAGMKPKDKIISIDGVSTYNLTSEEAVEKLRGKENTIVKVSVVREGVKDPFDVTIKRALVELKYVKSKMLPNKIGYLRLTQFGENVYPDIVKEVEKLQSQGMKGLIFDLRTNPGGILDQAIKISSMFIKEGRIVSVKSKDGKEQISMREGKYYGDFPLVVLVNGGSASASEIVAGAIKDNKRGVLVGEKTFGKGSVQTLVNLPDGDGIKLTIAKYYTPSGVCIHGVGIKPDVEVQDKEGYMLFDSMITNIDEKGSKANKKELIKEIEGEAKAKEFENHKDVQLEKAIEIIMKKIK